MSTRLPSFNDFSPTLLNHDLRRVLSVVADNAKDEKTIFAVWEKSIFPKWNAKRVCTNITATLTSTQLIVGRPMILSAFGARVKSASSATNAARIFCTEIIKSQNGKKLVEAITNLQLRDERATKETLQTELQRLGITDLANNTTDHTTLKNWMIQAGIVVEEKRGYPAIDDVVLKTLTGISSAESNELQSLTLGQQVDLAPVFRTP